MPVQPSIAVLSLACRYPDAASPSELWANVLEGRRSFRAIPSERLELAHYASEAIGEADSITSIRAGLLTNWSFDRARFRIPKGTFEATDLTHWLALQLAADAIEAVGGPGSFDRDRTAVVVANTLAGEFSRASLLRLRAPFLDGILAHAADNEGIAPDASQRLRREFAAELRRRFPDPNEDSLAGGLANTIAGRIANHFDLHGGAYTVDGACASSLIAVADAANLLATGQADAVIVGAVDLSLDPFELVGFSRNGALAKEEMRVFDARSSGFWPGEGGAFAVLIRDEDGRRSGRPYFGRIRGWGLSTDGAGGLTRPSSEGQLAAYLRAYEGAVADPADLAFVEAHGTGTAVGDPTEIRALARLRNGSKGSLPIGSIKANFGHTKAAAGFAGLIKAIEGLRRGIIAPHVGCNVPHPVFAEVEHRVRPALVPERVDGQGMLAGVSSFGFGGINAHIVLERAGTTIQTSAEVRAPKAHDCELFLFAGSREDEVLHQLDVVADRAASMSMSELTDAAAEAARNLRPGPLRVAVVAANASELGERLARARLAVSGGGDLSTKDSGTFVGRATVAPRVGFVFPGQAAPSRPGGGLWPRCFAAAQRLIGMLPVYSTHDKVATEIAQPAIMAANLAGLAVLTQMGIRPDVAIGHSVGEVAALSWAGALTQKAALELARLRGEIMARDASAGGTMLRVALSATDVRPIADDCGAVIACENGPAESVLSGPRAAIERAAARCRMLRVETTQMPVSHAFHSADMVGATPALRGVLSHIDWRPCTGAVISTVTGAVIEQQADLSELLVTQLTTPVRFDAAMLAAQARADVFVEVGPGHGLSRLIRDRGASVVSIDAFGPSLAPLLSALGELHVRGCDIRIEELFAERPTRAFDSSKPIFIASPCGSRSDSRVIKRLEQEQPAQIPEPILLPSGDGLAQILDVVRAHAGLPEGSFGPDDRFLDNLHLSSLAVTRIVAAAAKAFGVRAPSAPTEFANATPRILYEALKELGELHGEEHPPRVSGVRPWVETYETRWIPARAGNTRDRLNPATWSSVTIGGPPRVSSPNGRGTGRLIRIDCPFTRPVAEDLIALAVEAARHEVPHFAIVHSDAPVSGFARSLAQEGSFQTVRVVGGVDASMTESQIASALDRQFGRYSECRFGPEGSLEIPVFVPMQPACHPSGAIGSDDITLVVGGGRGIAAECALRLGLSGSALILVGRSRADESQVADTLARAKRNELRCAYVQADVTNEAELMDALAPSMGAFGAPTVLVHAAGLNEPMRIGKVDADSARRSLAPKLDGLAHAIAACGPGLRRVITFGSIIGRIGLEGEAHYALANAAQSAAADAWARAGSGRSALALEWSVWGGLGMGERLGTIERLSSSGVDPISLDDALEKFEQLVQSRASGTIVVTSRFGPPPDLDLGVPELPPLRFVDQPLLFFPAKELVVETALTRGRDRYLDDHIVDGRPVLPGVLGLEAMAQVASCLSDLGLVTAIEKVTFDRAITVDASGETHIRVAALRSDTIVEAAIFADDDGFAAPAMRARFEAVGKIEGKPDDIAPVLAVPCDFEAPPLYGPLFFNAGRFRRLERIVAASSRHLAATFSPHADVDWFGPYEPATRLLPDPAVLDACLHALQVIIPHRRVLPVAVGRIEIVRNGIPARVRAVEREARAGTYVFDILAEDEERRVVLRWHRVVFRAIAEIDPTNALSTEAQLVAPYLERLARESLGDDSIAIAIVSDRHSPREKRHAAALSGLGIVNGVEHRADGRPVRNDGNGSVSLAHAEDITLAVSAKGRIGCDIETPKIGTDGRPFVAFEACRKLGRRIELTRFAGLTQGHAFEIDGMKLLALEIPFGSVRRTIALSSLITEP